MVNDRQVNHITCHLNAPKHKKHITNELLTPIKVPLTLSFNKIQMGSLVFLKAANMFFSGSNLIDSLSETTFSGQSW